MEDGSSAGTPAAYGGDLSAPPGSWLLPGSALAVAAVGWDPWASSWCPTWVQGPEALGEPSMLSQA